METIDEREMQKTTKEKQTKAERRGLMNIILTNLNTSGLMNIILTNLNFI